MASIQRLSDNSIRVTVSLGYDISGRKLKKSKNFKLDEKLTPRQREKEITRLSQEFEQQVLSGRYLDGETTTFEYFAEKWLEFQSERLAPSTYTKYKSIFNHRLVPHFGHLKLSKIKPHNILEFHKTLVNLDIKYLPKEGLIDNISSLSKHPQEISQTTYKRLLEGKSVGYKTASAVSQAFNEPIENLFITQNKELSSKTMKHVHSALSACFETAVKWNVITVNPCKHVSPPKGKQKQAVESFDEAQIKSMLAALEGEPLKYRVLTSLAIDTGARLGELMGLYWSDVDFDNNAVSISRQRQYVYGQGVVIREPKTKGSIRRVSVSPNVIALLRSYKREQAENRLKLGDYHKQNNFVFIHEDGQEIYPQYVRKWFVKFLERHNLPSLRWHDLRHVNASILISSGIDVVTLSSRLGHSNKNTTLGIYSHMIESREKLSANMMQDFYDSEKLKINR